MEADMRLRTSSGTISTGQRQVIEVHVAESRDLFHAIDQSPFKQRDLDPVAEDFIVGWARESRQDLPLSSSARILRSDVSGMVRESLLIGGWVAMWRPIELFLYDWWPIRAEAQLAERLAAMPVRIVYKAPRGTA
jgi:hypothetical protein